MLLNRKMDTLPETPSTNLENLPELGLSPSMILRACSPPAVENYLLPSPPRFPIMDTYDPDFSRKLDIACQSSLFGDSLRLKKYGAIANKYRRGTTPSPARRLWAAQLELSQWELDHAESMSESSDDEGVTPAVVRTNPISAANNHSKQFVDNNPEPTGGRKRKREGSVPEDLETQHNGWEERTKPRNSAARGNVEHTGKPELPPSPVESTKRRDFIEETGIAKDGDSKYHRRVKSCHHSTDASQSYYHMAHENMIRDSQTRDNDKSDHTSPNGSLSDFIASTADNDNNTAGTTPTSTSPLQELCTWENGDFPGRTQAPLPDEALRQISEPRSW